MMSSENLYSAYESFAWMYNEAWGPQYCRLNWPVLGRLLLQHLSDGTCILDLCCGTGQVMQQLLLKGYQVTGLDSSEEMLRYARKNAPNSELILGDACSFKLPPTFHAVVSTTSAMNEIGSFGGLKNVFHNVRAALLDNGLFLFDLILEEGFQSLGRDGSIIDGNVKDEYAWAFHESYQSEDKKTKSQMTIFQLVDKIWKRSDINWQRKAYSRAEVQSALEDVGFTDIGFYNNLKGEQTGTGYMGNAFFVCRK